ncbi:hypothetical protein GGR57DRAFT_484233 [Xylariaceae sp. FL1272]|nr:hypothetical protein GGR57DRAFT_484233 [Xylariaceae sp. FL1272]
MDHEKPRLSLDIVVVGAGLSGLAAAISSALSGHKVTVLEAAPRLQEIGAGIQITPNSSRLLEKWGLPASFWETTCEPGYVAVHRYSDGKILAFEEEYAKNMRTKYGAPFIDVHRVDLHFALATRAGELGVDIQTNNRVTGIDFSVPSVKTVVGTTLKPDLIVGADGIWSTCRHLYMENPDRPLSTGDNAYRISLTLDQIDDPELRDIVQKPGLNFWIGPYGHVVAYSVRAGTVFNMGLIVPEDVKEEEIQSRTSEKDHRETIEEVKASSKMRVQEPVEEMRALFEKWDPMLTRFLDLVKGVRKWELMHRVELESWVNKEATCVFVGDSCHPMLPYLAQGANSALEDGAVLGLLLGAMKTREQLPKALNMYQALRKARGDAIAKEAFRQRDAFHMPDGPEQEARDELLLSQLGKEVKGPFPSRWTCPVVQPWLYGYDAYREVEEAVERDPFE